MDGSGYSLIQTFNTGVGNATPTVVYAVNPVNLSTSYCKFQIAVNSLTSVGNGGVFEGSFKVYMAGAGATPTFSSITMLSQVIDAPLVGITVTVTAGVGVYNLVFTGLAANNINVNGTVSIQATVWL